MGVTRVTCILYKLILVTTHYSQDWVGLFMKFVPRFTFFSSLLFMVGSGYKNSHLTPI